MTSADRLERELPRVLEQLYLGPRPPYADDAVHVAAHSPRGLRGPTIEHWLPPTSVGGSIVATPRFPWRAAGVVALVALTLVAATLFIGSQRDTKPAPYGPAGNGLIAYEYARDIYVGDPITGETRAITTGFEVDSNPVFSPDGLRIAFLRGYGYYPVLDDRVDVVTVRPDGSDLRVLTEERRSDIVSCCAWSPDGSTVFVETGIERTDPSDPGWWELSLAGLDASRRGDPRTLVPTAADGPPPPCCGGAAITTGIASQLRPPNGDRILGLDSGWPHHTITETDLDGGDTRPVVTLPSFDVRGPAWSPDGSTIAFIAALVSEPCGPVPCVPEQRAYLVNADGNDLRLLAPGVSAAPAGSVTVENGARWSPDGSKIALLRWTEPVNPPAVCCSSDGPRGLRLGGLTIVDVTTGAGREIEIAPDVTHFGGWSWSPDGRSLVFPRVEVAPLQYRMILLDVESGLASELPWPHHSDVSWQRVAS